MANKLFLFCVSLEEDGALPDYHLIVTSAVELSVVYV